MSDRPSQTRILVAAGVVIAVATFLLLRTGSRPETSPAMVPGSASSPSDDLADDGAAESPGSPGLAHRREGNVGMGDLKSDDEAAEYLREQFGATIDNKHTQIKAIEKLINYLMQRYPNDWQSRLQALLAKAFPGLADQLFATFQSMTAYNEWLKANHEELAKMSYEERRDALHDARFRFFGADADEIFAESNRQEQVLDAMAEIRESHDTTVGQKLETYMDAIDEAYGDAAPQLIERRQTELMTRFLALDSVQDDLHAMTPEQRRNELAGIRSAMGLDEQAQARWRELDTERDTAWDLGERYMAERQKILGSASGGEQQSKLATLRTSLFGTEDGDVIRAEEESGFFRFDHRRVYGKE